MQLMVSPFEHKHINSALTISIQKKNNDINKTKATPLFVVRSTKF